MPVNPKPVAIVTGGGHGLGRSYAILLAQRGMRVVVNSTITADISGEGPSAHRVAQEIQRSGGEAVACPADVSNWSEASRLVTSDLVGDVFPLEEVGDALALLDRKIPGRDAIRVGLRLT